ncbi:MAG: Na/Pi cotransporter family protein, partial [Oscillospiraceae bacterium]|nr:Na/Pi cotransporter family protein [Oscillospiraceae bacterium]
MDYPSIIISFLGSLGLFLFGMTVLSSALQKSAGSKMKQLLGKMSKSRFRGVLFGAGVTAVIQSSTATTVMAVGFVNAGIISLTQIVGIIMGANIGSTTTSWLVSSVEWMSFLKPVYLGSAFAAAGAFMLLFSKKSNVRSIGEVLAGFGVLFIGLSQMPDAVRPLTQLPVVQNAFVTFGNNPLLALLVGILVTAVIQSSTASIGILQSMAVMGVIPWSAAVFIVLGQNVGTCFTTMLTSIGANRNTRAASFVHFVYNAVGAVVFSFGAFIFFTFVSPEFGTGAASSTNISMIHTGYNVLLLLLLFPLGNVIMRIAVKMAGKEKVTEEEHHELIIKLDEHILETPEYALGNSVRAINTLIETLRENMRIATDPKRLEEGNFWQDIAAVDKYIPVVKAFLSKLHNEKLSEQEHVLVVVLLQNMTSLQRISNHTKGIVKQMEDLQKEKLPYTEDEKAMLSETGAKMLSCYSNAVEAFETREAF